MGICNGPGRPTELTDEVKARVLAAVPEVIIQNQVALRAKVSKKTLHSWLKRGINDKEEGIDSIYAQFSDEFHYAQTEVIKETLDDIKGCPKNYGALTWILEKCFREDFGKESEELRQILEKFAIIFPLLGKGAALNGEEAKEVDKEGYKTSGCTP